MKKISVILPVYNGEKFLIDAMESVLKQNLIDFDFLICDDCSTDKSWDLINKYANHPNIKIFKNKINLGLFKTLNFLLSKTSTDLIHLWSQDDVMKPHCLQECIIFHEKHPDLLMSYSGRDYIDENGKLIELYQKDETPEVISSELYAYISAYWGCIAGNIANVTLTKKGIAKAGNFNENYEVSGDFEMWTRLSKNGDIGFLNQPLIFLRRHLGQLSRSYKSTYLSMKEDIPILLNINEMVADEHRKKVQICLTWKTQVIYFNEMLFLVFKKEINLATKCLFLLANHSNIFLLFFRWLLIRFLRTLKKDMWFYKNILHILK
ncbi:glycosyltransferase [Pedobacter aquae]|uniref:Glycosyltransferase n=1 Tax=Pedobacter aquae TaxID=2605747 RepID=A0A5C0VGC6_9SPHI|nr:glycosyltransferase [Pedobacter aquae]QEK50320.1 glycosyltransferase [Pedobacter aquae]